MMTTERLQEIENAANEATAGPWGVDKYGDVCLAYDDEHDIFELCGTIDDAEFIALARTAVPELLEEVKRLRGELHHAEIERDDLMEQIGGTLP
jgi:hypothetical protein